MKNKKLKKQLLPIAITAVLATAPSVSFGMMNNQNQPSEGVTNVDVQKEQIEERTKQIEKMRELKMYGKQLDNMINLATEKINSSYSKLLMQINLVKYIVTDINDLKKPKSPMYLTSLKEKISTIDLSETLYTLNDIKWSGEDKINRLVEKQLFLSKIKELENEIKLCNQKKELEKSEEEKYFENDLN